MKTGKYILISLLLIIAQVIVWNIVDMSQYVILSFLPAIIFCLPTNSRTTLTMVIAFAVGFIADFFSTGLLGLSIVSLLPVALARKLVILMVLGDDVIARNEDINLNRQGVLKINLCLLILCAIFLVVYIIADDAGTRPFWFNLVRFLSSLVVSTLASLFATALLSSEENGRWR